MRCNVLAICDEQTTYVDFLTKQWLRKEGETFQVCRFATEEQLLAFAREQRISCLLVSELHEEVISQVNANQYFCFTNDRDRDGEQRGKIQYIYRFQSMEAIYQLICKSSDEDFFEELEGQLLGIYNPVHRNGQTSFAKALARSLSLQGKQVLYLNMEEYSGEADQESRGCLGEVLYYLKKDVKSINYRLASFTKKRDGYDYIVPMRMSEELRRISGPEWVEFFHEIMEKNVYQVVILDLDSCIQGLLDIFEQCHRIYMPIRKSTGGGMKRKQFYDNLKMLQKEALFEKITCIEIPGFTREDDAGDGEIERKYDAFIANQGRM